MIEEKDTVVAMPAALSPPGSHVRRRSGLGRVPFVPLVIVVGFVATALLADHIASGSPYEQHLTNRLQPPFWMTGGSWDTPLGTDKLGRDLLARLVYGARITLAVTATALALGGVLGLAVGMFSGYFGGWTDRLLMRVTDAALAIPMLFLALLFAVTMGASITTVIIAISLVIWSRFARIIRAEVLRIKENAFIAQARIGGLSHLAILMQHVLPNILNTWIVLLSLELGAVVIMEASLSFLGAGVPPPNPTWGSLVSDGREFVASAWWCAFFPGLAITLVVLSFNMFGDWLRDVLDPRLRDI